MKKKQIPAAFLSYAHEDDKYEHITKFRERLGDEVQMVVGEDFIIFQDRKDIHWGQNWRQRLEESIDEVTFLIPIITPRFFNSPYCRDELQRFLEREKKLGRNDLILPVYFVDTPLLNDDELRAKDELAQAIASRQYADWRNLRHEPFTNPLVGRTLEKLAMQIRDALLRVRPPQESAALGPVPSKIQQSSTLIEETRPKPAPTQPTKVEPPTCVVDPLHRGDFANISEAISKSKPGTRILIRPGLYHEGLIIDKPLEIIGDGDPSEIIVQASDKNVLLFQTTMGRVTNLTLRQAGGDNWYAVDIAQGRLELEDCDITSQSLACVAIHDGADPRLRRNHIHEGKAGGVLIYKNGLGTLEDNDIFGNAFTGVEISEGGNTTLRRNRIRDGINTGVLIYKNGLGTLEDNDIFGNANAGITVDGGNPTVRNNRINKNRYEAIWIYDEGGGTFEGNDLRDNARGAWDVAADCVKNVKRSNNQE